MYLYLYTWRVEAPRRTGVMRYMYVCIYVYISMAGGGGLGSAALPPAPSSSVVERVWDERKQVLKEVVWEYQRLLALSPPESTATILRFVYHVCVCVILDVYVYNIHCWSSCRGRCNSSQICI